MQMASWKRLHRIHPFPQRGMTAQDSKRLSGATGNVGLEPEDLGLNFTVFGELS